MSEMPAKDAFGEHLNNNGSFIRIFQLITRELRFKSILNISKS